MRPAGETLLLRSHGDPRGRGRGAFISLPIFSMANTSPTSSAQAPVAVPTPAPSTAGGPSTPVALGVPYKDSFSAVNSKIVFDAVKARFADWADQCQPYVNVLT